MNGGRGLLIAIVVAFVVGCSAGLVGGIVYARFALGPGMHGGPPRGAPRGPGGRTPMMERLERTLDLSADQRRRIELILDGSRKGYAIVRESTHAQIERELTPEQRVRWRQAEERFLRERRRGFGPGRPPWRGDRP